MRRGLRGEQDEDAEGTASVPRGKHSDTVAMAEMMKMIVSTVTANAVSKCS